jgi:hypothetical protein
MLAVLIFALAKSGASQHGSVIVYTPDELIPVVTSPTCYGFVRSGKCNKYTVCTGLYYTLHAGGTSSDATCGAITPFTLGEEYEVTPVTATTDRTVTSVTRCGIAEHVTVGPTATTDSICRPIVYTCRDGQIVSPNASIDGTVSATSNETQCTECGPGTTSYNTLCPDVCPDHHIETGCSQIESTYDCGHGSYYTPGLVPGHPSRSCTKCTVCETVYSVCTATADAVCFATNRSSGIQQCPSYQYRDDSTPGSIGICRQCSECAFKDIRNNCTLTHDIVCEAFSSEEFSWLWAIVALGGWTIGIGLFRLVPLIRMSQKSGSYITSDERQQLIQEE